MQYTVRFATKEDLKNVIDLAVEMVDLSTSPYRDVPGEEVREYRKKDLKGLYNAINNPNMGIFVAEDDNGRFLGHVIAMAGNEESSTGEIQGYIFDLSVIREMQGKGIGKNLMEMAENFCILNGMKYVCLNVTAANEQAVNFYEKTGYSVERKRMIKVLPKDITAGSEKMPAENDVTQGD